MPGEAMPIDLTDVIVRVLAQNRSPDPKRLGEKIPSHYGIAASLQGDIVRVDLRFVNHLAYCCMEPMCHLPMREGKRWRSLREAMAESGLQPPDRLRMELRVVVEEGALFFDWTLPIPGRIGWYRLKAAKPLAEIRLVLEEGKRAD
jgi:hypothetical protein